MKIMQVILDKKMPLSRLVEPVVIYPQVLKNARVTDRDKALQDEDIKAAMQKVEENLRDTGRLLVRKSGTEPLLRIMVEAPSIEECEENVNLILDTLQQKNMLLGVK
jgi:phosphoglucosamine mutase